MIWKTLENPNWKQKGNTLVWETINFATTKLVIRPGFWWWNGVTLFPGELKNWSGDSRPQPGDTRNQNSNEWSLKTEDLTKQCFCCKFLSNLLNEVKPERGIPGDLANWIRVLRQIPWCSEPKQNLNSWRSRPPEAIFCWKCAIFKGFPSKNQQQTSKIFACGAFPRKSCLWAYVTRILEFRSLRH